MVDQLNYKCLGHRGHLDVKTPNLDALKKDSIDFTHAYVANAFCVPSRISCLTGLYPWMHREYGFHGLIDSDCPSMAQVFGRSGYTTALTGKAHVNPMGELLGFDHFIPTLPEDIIFSTDPGVNFKTYSEANGFVFPTDQNHGGDAFAPLKEKRTSLQRGAGTTIGLSHLPAAHSIERYTADKAMELIGQNKGKPFFIQVSFDRPHPPLSPSAPWADMYDPQSLTLDKPYTDEELSALPPHIQKAFKHSPFSIPSAGDRDFRTILAMYYGLISHIDDEIGRVISCLKEKGLYDNTILLFFADHGDMGGYNGMFNKYSNTIFHDNIIRTPLLLKLPDSANAGMETDSLCETIDIFPTLLNLCGISGPPLPGQNLMDLVNDPGVNKNHAAFSESYAIKTIIKDDWKLIYYVNGYTHELYNLKDDPGERKNIYPNFQNEESVNTARIIGLKQEIIKKMTPEVSEERKNFIRKIFSPVLQNAMEYMHKWDRNISGGGLWTICRDDYRLVVVPFDNICKLYRSDPQKAIPGINKGYIPYDDLPRMDALLNELINFIATSIRPVSLMSGSQGDWDAMLQTKGQGLV